MTDQPSPTSVLGADFWRWRAAQQPRTGDDIPRIARPAGWVPRWSADDVASYRVSARAFEEQLAALPPAKSRAEGVDRMLLASACARVRWELDYLRVWQTQPRFYADQTIGAVFDLLTPPNPTEDRLAKVADLLAGTEGVLSAGRANLTGHGVAELSQITVGELSNIEGDIDDVIAALGELPAAAALHTRLRAAGTAARHALADFRDWVDRQIPSFRPLQPIGEQGFRWFLATVALLPFTPEEMLSIGRQEASRAITLERLEQQRNRGRPAPAEVYGAPLCDIEMAAELSVRAFLEDRDLLSQPATLQHYRFRPMPDYLHPIRWLGVADDLTDPGRLDEDGTSYVQEFTGTVPYFHAANARDPRAGIVHEGAHYQQLALSFRHPNLLRRHYYDSAANEGIAFYNEEMALANGLFDDQPATREVMYNFMRLRALRVEVDVLLALGRMSLAEASDHLRRVVPMDQQTASEEATFFAGYPGQGLSYQIGKTQILALFADTLREQGAAFSIRRFHDRLWNEGNVPLSLQRWELLDDDSEIRRARELADLVDANAAFGQHG